MVYVVFSAIFYLVLQKSLQVRVITLKNYYLIFLRQL